MSTVPMDSLRENIAGETDPNGNPYVFRYSTNGGSSWRTYYYLLNQQGDVEALVDSYGAICATYTYDAWGNPLTATTTSSSEVSTLADINPIRYRGYYYDTQTGLYYLQSRYYDPEVGRFINADLPELAEAAAYSLRNTNLFVYCKNNPNIYADYNGEDAILLIDSGDSIFDFGHIGALVQDEDDKWHHFYFGGEKYVTAPYIALVGYFCGSNDACNPRSGWMDYTGATTLQSINQNTEYAGNYTDRIHLVGDYSSCIDAFDPNTKYNLYRSNCAKVTMRTLAAANTKDSAVLQKASSYLTPQDAFNYVLKNIKTSRRPHRVNRSRRSACRR